MASTAQRGQKHFPARNLRLLLAGCWLTTVLAGCVAPPLNWWKKSDAVSPPGAMDSMVLRGSGLEADKIGPDAPVYGELEGAKKLFQENDFEKSEPIFAKLANNTKNPLPIAEESRYYEAECQRLKGDYRTAEGTYKRLLKDFRNGQYTDQANRRLFDIANYWLDETRKQMDAYEQNGGAIQWFAWPTSYIHFSKDKPLFDMEGHAVQALEEVRLNDINGPLGEKALFYLATVKFFRQDYREADYYYTQLYQQFPNSTLAPKSLKQAIICKQICTGGSPYDGRTVEEARKLVDVASRAYPQLASKEEKWLERQVISINMQQAERDFNIAEFYRRTGKPGSAFFYYELVRRRYQGTTFAEQATNRMAEIRGQVEREQATQQQAETAFVNDNARNRTGLMGYLFPAGRQKKQEEPAPMPPVPGEPLR
jgi:outer membrane protein assembly factor BamD (BamD/ComL family)